MRISIFQLIALATATGAMIAIFAVDENSKLTWLSHPLRYQEPVVPENYKGMAKSPNCYSVSGPVVCGRDLFREAHFDGWKAYRYHFYRDFDLINETYVPTRELESIDLQKTPYRSAEKLAYVHGYLKCEADIQQLLMKYSRDELRRKLAIPRATNRASFFGLLAVSLICFGLAWIPRNKAANKVSGDSIDSVSGG